MSDVQRVPANTGAGVAGGRLVHEYADARPPSSSLHANTDISLQQVGGPYVPNSCSMKTKSGEWCKGHPDESGLCLGHRRAKAALSNDQE